MSGAIPTAARIVLQSGVVATWVGLGRHPSGPAGPAPRPPAMAADPHPFTAFAGRYSDRLDRPPGRRPRTPAPTRARCTIRWPSPRSAGRTCCRLADAHLDVQLDGVARGCWWRTGRPPSRTTGGDAPRTVNARIAVDVDPAGFRATTSPHAAPAMMAATPRSTAGRPLRLAIVGTGSRGDDLRPRGVRTGEAVVTAVAEPRPDRRAAGRGRVRRAADGVGRRLARTSPRGPISTSMRWWWPRPDRQHTAPALAFLARGLPLLLEKPMAPNDGRGPQHRGRRRAGER